MSRRSLLLKLYGWVFLAAGAVFVAFPASVLSLMGLLCAALPGASPLPGELPSLWLGLSGSLMAVLGALAFRAAGDAGALWAWDLILLSKLVSSLLFAAFALVTRNSLFLAGTVVDGAIFAHLLRLFPAAERDACAREDWWRPRLGRMGGRGYEVWFFRTNVPETGNALWLRASLGGEAKDGEAAFWYVLFDRAAGKVEQGRWSAPLSSAPAAGGDSLLETQACELGRSRFRVRGAEASWDIAWKAAPVPAFSFVPAWLQRWGIAGSMYASPASLAEFSGTFRLGERELALKAAPGCAGHLWGRRMGDDWRWAHAAFPDGQGGTSVFEILSARAAAGPFRTPRVTTARLWHLGRHHYCAGLGRGLRAATWSAGEGWGFHLPFPGFTAEGECVPDSGLTAVVEYADTDGSRRRCENSKTGTVTLRLDGLAGPSLLSCEGSAAVETVRRA